MNSSWIIRIVQMAMGIHSKPTLRQLADGTDAAMTGRICRQNNDLTDGSDERNH